MRTQTIEATAKRWKAVQAAGLVALFLSVAIGLVAGNAVVRLLMAATGLLSLIVFACGRALAWWYHG